MNYLKAYSFFKAFLYHTCRVIGLFKLSRCLTGRSLRILCYHGFEICDESEFRPLTFIKNETFRRRLSFLRKNQFKVIRLEDAINLLKQDKLTPLSVAITIDDGFYSTYKNAAPILEEFSFPSVVYVTTYYVINQTPVFRLVIQYMFWKTDRKELDISELTDSKRGIVNIADPLAREKTIWDVIKYGENECNQAGREIILRKLGKLLNVDYDRIEKSRMLSMMNLEELKLIQKKGVDLELHTHRHNFPVDKATAIEEIEENREVLQRQPGTQANHFCYPSGEWDRKQFAWLEEMGIKSCVTCDPGLNRPRDNKFALKRFLDGENISEIEFEAELCGFSEMMRRIKKIFIGSDTYKK